MSFFQRIAELVRMFFSFFLEGAEGRVPIERRLAYDRVKRAENVKRQMAAAEDVGAAAELMVQQLAESRIMAANVRHEAKAHLEAAAAAAKRGDAQTQAQEEARAAQLAEELASAESEVQDLERLMEEALADKKEAIGMVLEQARELEKLSRGDARLVARTRMTEMRRQQLELREQMMELVPGDSGNMRARVQERIQHDEAKYRARRDVVDALWEQKKRGTVSRAATTAAGAAMLEQLKQEVGYAPAAEAPAPAPSEEEAAGAATTGAGGGAGSAGA